MTVCVCLCVLSSGIGLIANFSLVPTAPRIVEHRRASSSIGYNLAVRLRSSSSGAIASLTRSLISLYSHIAQATSMSGQSEPASSLHLERSRRVQSEFRDSGSSRFRWLFGTLATKVAGETLELGQQSKLLLLLLSLRSFVCLCLDGFESGLRQH